MDAPPMTTKQHQEAAAANSSSSAALGSGIGVSGIGGGGSGGSGCGATGINSSAMAPHQSPRNLASGGVAWQMGTVEVSKALQDGEKFVKWDEVSFVIQLRCCGECEIDDAAEINRIDGIS